MGKQDTSPLSHLISYFDVFGCCVYTICMPQMPEFLVCCKLPCGYGELNSAPLQEQPVLFTAKLPLQPFCCLFPLVTSVMSLSGWQEPLLLRVATVLWLFSPEQLYHEDPTEAARVHQPAGSTTELGGELL